MINTYEGKVIDRVGDYIITESNIRPASFRFEASREDGEPSLFGSTLEELLEELN